MVDVSQRLLEEQIFANRQKKAFIAYILLFLLGGLGVHRFYLGLNTSGLIYLGLFVLGLIIPITFVAIFIWWIVDIFMIPSLTETANLDIRADIRTELGEMKGE